jgi:hypothetical protein
MKRLLCIVCVLGVISPALAQVGDGKTDDTAALQQLLDTRGPFTSLKLKSGAVYRITANLHRDRPIILESTAPGRPAILRYDFDPDHSPPFNRCHFTLAPRLGPPRIWKEVLTPGQRPNMAPALDPKKHYIVAYGTARSDPYDYNENEQVDFADGAEYPPANHDIKGDVHYVAELLAIPDGSVVRDIRFEVGQDSGLDMALWIARTRGVMLANLSCDAPSFIQLEQSRSITIAGIRARVYPVEGHSASNRLLEAGMTRDVSLVDADLDASDAAASFMLENWCDGITIDRLRVHRRAEADKVIWPPCQPVFFSNGGSRNFLIRHVRIDGDLYAWDCGGQKDQPPPTIDLLEYTGRAVELSNVKPQTLLKLPTLESE